MIDQLVVPILGAFLSAVAVNVWEHVSAGRSELVCEQVDVPLRDPLGSPVERRSTLTRSFLTLTNASGGFLRSSTSGKTICPEHVRAPFTVSVPFPGFIPGSPRVIRCPNSKFPPILERVSPREFIVTKESTHLNPNESIEIQIDVRDPVLARGRVDIEVDSTITGASTPVDVGPNSARSTLRTLASLAVTFVALLALTVLYGLFPEHRDSVVIVTQIVAYLGVFVICRQAMRGAYRDARAAWTVSRDGENSLWNALRGPQSDPTTINPVRRAAEFVVMYSAFFVGLTVIYYAYLQA